MQQPTFEQKAKARYEQGLPANCIWVYSPEHIQLVTPKGSQTLRWDGSDLRTVPTGKPLNLNRVIMDQVAEAISTAHGAEYEYKYGAEIEDGDREGWELVTDVEDVTAGAAIQYRRLVDVARHAEIWFSASDLVK